MSDAAAPAKGKRPNRGKSHRGARANSKALAPTQRPSPVSVSEAIEKVLLQGDLTPLSPEQRLEYYKAVCKSLGLNYLTGPFGYIAFKETENAPAKLVLYAKRDCTEQLRKIHGIGVTESDAVFDVERALFIVKVKLMDKNGKPDTGMGVVSLNDKFGKPLIGKNLANAMMRAETKAKRRGTLSAAGLGMLDESELPDMEYNEVSSTGRVLEVSEPENKHLTAYEQREREGIAKLNDAQRKIVERRMADAAAKSSPAPGLEPVKAEDAGGTALTNATLSSAPPYDGLTFTPLRNGMYEITGLTSVKHLARALLKKYWDKPSKTLLAGPGDVGKLCGQLERNDPPIKYKIEGVAE
jgi:hypothetical protein